MSGVLMVQYRFTTCFNDLWNRLVVSTVGSRVLLGSFFYTQVYSDHIGGLSFEDMMGVQQNTMKREGKSRHNIIFVL